MDADDSAALETAATDDSDESDQRDTRALTECMTVLPETGQARGAPDLFVVVSASGREYLVDTREDACNCPDAMHRDPTAAANTFAESPSQRASGISLRG